MIFSYDAESKIVEVSGAATDSFVYDGDGNRVKSIVGSTTTVFIGNYYEWESNATRKHYYAGANRIAMRDGETLYFLFGDHLGSTSLSYRVSDGYVARHLYKPWGEKRYPPGASELPTKYRFTGQYVQNELWLYYYNARWYDNRVGRFIQADTDVPESQGENQNPTEFIGRYTYSPLVVDYHENQSLEQLNSENKIGFQNPEFSHQSIPTSSIAFDRYAYSLNNPVRYVDPNGHFAILAALALITPLGWVAIAVSVAAVGVYFAVPGVKPAVTAGIAQAGQAVTNGIKALFAKDEYVPPGLSDTERRAYGEAVHLYKDIWGLGATDDVLKEILDDIAELVKEGKKPIDAAESVDGPPEDEIDEVPDAL